jgi:hypothetical protein
MKRALRLGLPMFALLGAAAAQTVQVYSEFARLSDKGEVLAPENPREILSPAVARNAFSTFQIAIQAPKGTKFELHMGQNPPDAVKVTLYRRSGETLARADLPQAGESSQVYWMDVWVDSTAPVRRIKLEPQVRIHGDSNGDWVTYPMEVRVSDAVVPEHPAPEQGVASPLEVMHAFLCGGQPRPPAGRVAIGAELRFRNAQQDVALAGQSSAAQLEELKKVLGGCSGSPPEDPEFYLRLRDLIFTSSAKKVR